ncbi:phage head morphogenesis protein [Streptomyces sp. AcH 505]|uniref:phage head morphogenesis protein n=1 Tax=Streptomyces sp. AcH 505 TaxID=352211 RepID=UPI0018E2F267
MFTPDQVAALLSTVVAGRQVTGVSAPLPRVDPQVAFGPGMPLIPSAIDPLRPDSGRPEPRFNEYPVSSNLPGVSDRLVPWKVLRDAADAGGLARRCIEIRKAEVAGLEWTITLTKGAIEAAQAGTDQPRHEVDQALRQKLSSEISRCMAFWEKPDRGQGENFSEWLGKALEEHLVLDALSIYPRRTYSGDLYALEIIDGSTIKPLRDYRGGRPLPPNPAYQQLLWGFPRGEFVADADENGDVFNGYLSDQFVYKRRNVRAHTLYGYSAVEQALEDIDTWLRRRQWIRAEYTEGTVPAGLLRSSAANQWTPAQLKEYEVYLNDAYAGSTAARHRLRVLPPGMELETQPDVAERYRPEYDLFLIKLIASHFDTTMAELGFTEQGGLGSTGWHEGQADVQQRKGTLPTLRWFQELITDISRLHLRMAPELEFRFLGLEEEDAGAADEVAGNRIRSARITLNEDRDQQGMPRYDFPEADMPMVQTTSGVIFLKGASDNALAGALVMPPKAEDQEEAKDAAAAPAAARSAAGADDTDEDEDEDVDSGRATAVKAELGAYRRWARKNPSPARPFRFSLVTKADAPDLGLMNHDHVLFAGGDATPKAREPDSVRDWPGWGPDIKAVAYWKPRLIKAMRAAADTRALAERWIAQRGIAVKADEPDLGGVERSGGDQARITPADDASGWLAAQDLRLIDALVIIRDMQTDGFIIGERSAGAVLAGHSTVDWDNWKPGDPDAARLVASNGATNGLQQLLDDAGVTIRSVAATRMDHLANALSDALARGDSADTLGRTLRGVLTDPAWAERVAVTEISRAVSTASLNTYRLNGITQKSWLTAVDDRVCAVCMTNSEAGAIPINQAFNSGDMIPPGHPSCFPAGVMVAGSPVVATTARRYEGDLLTIVLAGGQEVPVTPNHPVLTPDGWVPAGDLNKGREVLRAADVERVASAIYPDDCQAVSRIEDVTGALGESGAVSTELMPLAAEDFHGDGAGDDQVKVVRVERNAELDFVPEAGQEGTELRFQRAANPAPSSEGAFDLRLDGARGTSGSGVRCVEHPSALSFVGPLPSQRHRGGTVAGIDASLAKHPVDGATGKAVLGRERFDRDAFEVAADKAIRDGPATSLGTRPTRDTTIDKTLTKGLDADAAEGSALAQSLAGLVTRDRVIEVRRISNWSGHVYNLETVDGWYFANGIIAHNCRCTPYPETGAS